MKELVGPLLFLPLKKKTEVREDTADCTLYYSGPLLDTLPPALLCHTAPIKNSSYEFR